MTQAVTLADIEAAAVRLAGQVLDTPCVESKTLSQIVGAQVFLKFENLQFTASFKERGALNKLAAMVAAGEPIRGVIAASAEVNQRARSVIARSSPSSVPARAPSRPCAPWLRCGS